MANIRGIELTGEVYDLEDTSARDTATTASQTATQAGQTATQASQAIASLQNVIPSNASASNKLVTENDVSNGYVRREVLVAYPNKPKTITLKEGQIIRVCAFYYGGLSEESYITYNLVDTLSNKTTVFSAVSPGHSIAISGSTVTLSSTQEDTIVFTVEYLK